MKEFSKKSLTSLDVAVLVKEIASSLENGFIINVYGVDEDKYLFKVRGVDGRLILLYVEPGSRINVTKYTLQTTHKGKIQLFRRFLRDSQIASVKQYKFERIIIFDLRKGSSRIKLILELIPRGVLVITDEDYRVLMTSKTLDVKDRTIKTGLKYMLPPTFPDILSESINDLLRALPKKGKLGSVLIRYLGIPPEVVNEVLDDKLRNQNINDIEQDELITIINSIRKFIINVINNPEPVIVYSENNSYVSFHPFIPQRLWPANTRFVAFESFNEAIDEYFRALTTYMIMKKEIENIERERERLNKVLSNMLIDYSIAYYKLRELEKLIDVLSRNYQLIDSIIKCSRAFVKEKGWLKDLLNVCRVNSYDEKKGTVQLMINGLDIKLSIRDDLKKQYFELVKEASSLKKKLSKILEKKREVEAEISKLSEKVKVKAEMRPFLKVIEWYMSYHWIVTSNGCLAIGGRNAEQNEKIVRRYLKDNDIFMHADIHGAPVFIIFSDKCTIKDLDLNEVAVLAASYSKAWKLGLASVDVFWVNGNQVSTAAPPGQYLPKGSFMIYGKKNYIKNVKLELAIGIEIIDNKFFRIITGPEYYVNKRAFAYMVIAPGDDDVNEVAKKFLLKVKKAEPRLSRLSLEDITARIPGNSRIIKIHVKK